MDQHLLVFIKVAELGSFSRAAEQLHMTQPAVSQYIQTLERLLGVKLMDRSNKYVHINKAGEIVLHHAKEILGLYTRMQTLVADLSETARGELAIGASYTYGEYVLPHIVSEMSSRYPMIKPSITIGNTKEIAELVESRQLDVGVVEGRFIPNKLNSETIATDEMYVLASPKHPLAGNDEVSAEQLEQAVWIVREEGSGTREAADRLFAALSIRPDNLLQFGSTQLIKESVEAGLGITLLSQWATRKELALGSLSILKTKETPFIRDFSLITQPTSFHTKAMEVFWEAARSGMK